MSALRRTMTTRVNILVKSGAITVRLIRLHSPLVADCLAHPLATCAF